MELFSFQRAVWWQVWRINCTESSINRITSTLRWITTELNYVIVHKFSPLIFGIINPFKVILCGWRCCSTKSASRVGVSITSLINFPSHSVFVMQSINLTYSEGLVSQNSAKHISLFILFHKTLTDLKDFPPSSIIAQ